MAYSTISKPELHFNTVLYTGNATSRSITGVGFQPDFTWIKNRDSGSLWHQLQDAVRGAGKNLYSNNTNAEADAAGAALTSFDSDGFTIGTGNGVNGSGNNIVSWNWKAANSSGSSNSDGSITSTVSVNTTAGFSIVTYTGNGSAASFGHGLSTPDIVLIKDRTDAGNSWYFHTTAIDGSEDYLTLENDNTKSNAASGYSIGASVYNLGGGGTWVNMNSKNYVAYCFKQIKGYSKFNSYVGNGNADGPFVYTGFKPALVIIKDTTTSGTGHSWCLWDNKRSTFNPTTQLLLPDEADSEYTLTDPIDFLSNGFKIRDTNGSRNDSGSTYFYMAFAKEPLVANVGASIPATAR